jgi:hypothetical protein
MTNEVEIIQQVLDQAIQRGIIANLESAAAVWQAWGTIKYKVEESNEQRNTSANS